MQASVWVAFKSDETQRLHATLAEYVSLSIRELLYTTFQRRYWYSTGSALQGKVHFGCGVRVCGRDGHNGLQLQHPVLQCTSVGLCSAVELIERAALHHRQAASNDWHLDLRA